jgi:uncharacterized protein YjbI with pentapeptide repeats
MSPDPRPGAAARSPLAPLMAFARLRLAGRNLLVLLAPLALAVATSATADPLAAYGSYVGEDHSHHDHHHENLREINLSEANLTSANFTDAQLRAALLVDVVAVDALFTSAILWDANLSGADLTRANLTDANLKSAILSNAVLVDATLAGSELKDADFRGAHLLGANLANVLNGNLADFTGAYFDADTVLSAAIDDSVMFFVVGACPSNPSQYWIDSDRDGHGDHCGGVSELPEPGVAALGAGAALLAALARRRRG